MGWNPRRIDLVGYFFLNWITVSPFSKSVLSLKIRFGGASFVCSHHATGAHRASVDCYLWHNSHQENHLSSVIVSNGKLGLGVLQLNLLDPAKSFWMGQMSVHSSVSVYMCVCICVCLLICSKMSSNWRPDSCHGANYVSRQGVEEYHLCVAIETIHPPPRPFFFLFFFFFFLHCLL